MPNKEEHIKVADFNEEFGNFLIEKHNKYNSWAVVSFQYCALHWVEAYLSTLNKHCTSHISRENYLNRESNLRIIYPAYSQLYSDSRAARYQNSRFNDADFVDIITYLDEIKKHLLPLI